MPHVVMRALGLLLLTACRSEAPRAPPPDATAAPVLPSPTPPAAAAPSPPSVDPSAMITGSRATSGLPLEVFGASPRAVGVWLRRDEALELLVDATPGATVTFGPASTTIGADGHGRIAMPFAAIVEALENRGQELHASMTLAVASNGRSRDEPMHLRISLHELEPWIAGVIGGTPMLAPWSAATPAPEGALLVSQEPSQPMAEVSFDGSRFAKLAAVVTLRKGETHPSKTSCGNREQGIVIPVIEQDLQASAYDPRTGQHLADLTFSAERASCPLFVSEPPPASLTLEPDHADIVHWAESLARGKYLAATSALAGSRCDVAPLVARLRAFVREHDPRDRDCDIYRSSRTGEGATLSLFASNDRGHWTIETIDDSYGSARFAACVSDAMRFALPHVEEPCSFTFSFASPKSERGR